MVTSYGSAEQADFMRGSIAATPGGVNDPSPLARAAAAFYY
jgi:hypothetical protein